MRPPRSRPASHRPTSPPPSKSIWPSSRPHLTPIWRPSRLPWLPSRPAPQPLALLSARWPGRPSRRRRAALPATKKRRRRAPCAGANTTARRRQPRGLQSTQVNGAPLSGQVSRHARALPAERPATATAALAAATLIATRPLRPAVARLPNAFGRQAATWRTTEPHAVPAAATQPWNPTAARACILALERPIGGRCRPARAACACRATATCARR